MKVNKHDPDDQQLSLPKMPSEIASPVNPEIQNLWNEIQIRLHHHAQEMAETVKKIINLGDILIAEKEKIAHGQFGKWLETHFGDSGQATAYRYMHLAEIAKFITVRKIVEAVVHYGVPLTFLYSFKFNLIKSRETITLSDSIDLVATYRILRQTKAKKQAAKGHDSKPPTTHVAPPPTIPAPSTPATCQHGVSAPAPLAAPAPGGSINIPGYPLSKEVYDQLKQLQSQFGTSTIPATITRLVEREIRAQKIVRLIQAKVKISEKMKLPMITKIQN